MAEGLKWWEKLIEAARREANLPAAAAEDRAEKAEAALAQERERVRKLEAELNRVHRKETGFSFDQFKIMVNDSEARAKAAERQRDELVEAAKRLVYGRVDDRWDNEKALRRLLSRISHS